ncbi:MAG: hypothetical protein ACJAVX_002784 [Pseudoalteromonas rhizosphaerae]|jgi:hypothetical protein|uniref:delta-class carbonic anhydrase n=1 Tax=Pseudoalteromonas TaxID=53246 RepID=UPI0016042F72|nr:MULTISPECIES: delta-class carbonic anhydrase [unclassified Pseudoalteromonas]MBB1300768.1 hypothetical protein [Pseudoalteromonas sp. SR44-8]MBB1505662.1 hypothetical protein [Pseudoalteromonas sp. SG41-1]
MIKTAVFVKCACVIGLSTLAVTSAVVSAKNVSDSIVAEQREALDKNTQGKGFGPQSPRDIDQNYGTNLRSFGMAPSRSELNLCNIHFHKNAEHKGGEFTTYAGNGDGKGHHTGYLSERKLSAAQLQPVKSKICAAKGESLKVGDTLEVHFVYSSAQVTPGPTLGACLAQSTMNPALRVEGQVIVLANDKDAINFAQLANVEQVNGYYQAPNIPTNTGIPIEYLGSTTGPAYNEKASPLQVSWSVRPHVAVVDINSVGKWCDENVFNEDHAHGVRNLVQNPKLLSPISQ